MDLPREKECIQRDQRQGAKMPLLVDSKLPLIQVGDSEPEEEAEQALKAAVSHPV